MVMKVADKIGQQVEKFYVRSGNSSMEMPLSEMHSYVSDRFLRSLLTGLVAAAAPLESHCSHAAALLDQRTAAQSADNASACCKTFCTAASSKSGG
jgi:hypothetical protein